MASVVINEYCNIYRSTPIYKYDYGQTLNIKLEGNVTLPSVYAVQFSLTEKSGGQIIERIANDNVVSIPNVLLSADKTRYCIFAYIYLSDEDDGTTVYKIIIPVRAKAGNFGEDIPDEEIPAYQQTLSDILELMDYRKDIFLHPLLQLRDQELYGLFDFSVEDGRLYLTYE